METQSASSTNMLHQKVLRYAEAYEGSKAEEYAAARGISQAAASTFLLGCVPPPDECAPDEVRFSGMLSIPYLTPVKGAIAVKFRNLRPDAEPRYLAPVGQETHLYNVIDLHKPSVRVVVCEGEIDTMTVSMCGVPAVGLPGTQTWRSFYPRVFDGYKEVLILTDNDAKEDGSNPGQELARKVMREVMGARNVVLPDGYDANSFYLEYGQEALLDLLGVSHVSVS
jgi:5S rRNA maturation endonuclease (ribonuclease M5)